MASTLRHRGPDDGGVWVDSDTGVALAHRRLSILDLSPAGHQPMVSASGRYVVAFNGEIYNFLEIRQALDAAAGEGLAWRGHSDTEVLLAAVEAWGLEGALERFVGMFAVALWDRKERRLHLARDRMGEKPLYFGWQGKTFLFGSELKALRAHPDWQGEVDRDAIALLLRHNYVPAPYSIFERIYKLEPGCVFSVTPEDASRPLDWREVGRRLEPYWSLQSAVAAGAKSSFAGSDDEAVDELDELLRSSVRRQMVADVPLGAFLSGGYDSSTVVALMQAQSSQPVKTFSIGFHEPGFNEAEHAKAVAAHLGTDHTELYVTPSEAMAAIPRLPDFYDEPFADSSQIPTLLVAQLTRKHVTVSLSGDGGDELFGGYKRYAWGRGIWGRVGWIPVPLRRASARAIRSVPPRQWDRVFRVLGPALSANLREPNPGQKMHGLAEIMGAESGEAVYRGLVSHWKDPAAVVVGAREPPTALTDPDRWTDLAEFTHRMMYLDTISYLPGDILTKVDRAAMAVSLETRIPLLDHNVVELAWRLPLRMKVRGEQGKWILRQVLYRYVPRELMDRPKMGFGVPIDSWLRGPLREWAEDLLDAARLKREGFFDPGPIRKKWMEHQSGKRNWHYYIWDVLMFQAWLERGGSARIDRPVGGAAGAVR